MRAPRHLVLLLAGAGLLALQLSPTPMVRGFGLLLVVMMRFRPEGLVPSKRRQLEFHEEDAELVEMLQAEHLQEAK